MANVGFGSVKGSQVGGTTNGWLSDRKVPPKKIVLAGHDEARETIRAIAAKLKERGHSASAYFDSDVISAATAMYSSDLLLLGLSRAGREVSSPAHAREKTLLEMVAVMPKPILCAVVCDVDNYISAPYLTAHGGLVRLVATNDPKVDSLGIFKNPTRVKRDPQAIADAVCEILRSAA